jgi:hypothetical protein
MNRVLEDSNGKIAFIYGDRDDFVSENGAHRIAEVLGDKCFKKVLIQGSDHFLLIRWPW